MLHKLLELTKPRKHGDTVRVSGSGFPGLSYEELKKELETGGSVVVDRGYASVAYALEPLNEMTRSSATRARDMIRARGGTLFVVGDYEDTQEDLAGAEALLAYNGLVVDICGYLDQGKDNEKMNVPVIRAQLTNWAAEQREKL